jgi:tetratricopeptide (TPR) repeat protein
MKKLLAKAKALYKNDRYQSAMAIAKKILAIDPRNDVALFYMAHGLYHAGHFRRSLQYWKRLKKICPTEPSLHLNMGACYDDLGESGLAIQNYKRELELNPVAGMALYNLEVLYHHAHKYKLAAGYLERCYSQKHSVEAIVCKLAWCYFKTGQAEKEQILYEEYLQTHPNDTWALNNLGSHLMGQGEYHRALLRLKKAARIDPSDKLVAKNIRKTGRILKNCEFLRQSDVQSDV